MNVANLVSNTMPHQNNQTGNFQQNQNQNQLVTENQFGQQRNENEHNLKIIDTFFKTFINQTFFSKIINVLLYHSDFSSANGSLKTSDVTQFINSFINDVNKEIKKAPMNLFEDAPKSVLLSTTSLTREMVNLRENVTGRLVSYDNVLQHFPNQNHTVKKILSNVANERIKDQDTFKNELDDVLQTIQLYNQLNHSVQVTLRAFDVFNERARQGDLSPINISREFQSIVVKAYNEMSELTVLSKQDELDDYIILHDKQSTTKVVDNMVGFLKEGYNFYKTGYPILDDNVGGLESATFHLITGPSNHAKSIFMINIFKNMLDQNRESFVKGDVFVYITLEDDLNKVLRRFISIFGNINSELTKELFITSSNLFKSDRESYDQSTTTSTIKDLLTKIINNSIIANVSGGNCGIVLKHCAEDTFSPADATKFIDSLRIQGYNARAVFIDYVDVMRPSSSHYSNYNDYDGQGVIVHELRKISQNYKLPVVSITQNTRESENTSNDMGNQLVGDSYKKIRFSDYIYMIRLRSDLTVQSTAVREHVTNQEDDVKMFDMTGQYIQNTVPFELKITKAKEGKKTAGRFHVFSGMNLRIYSTLQEFYDDINAVVKNDKSLQDHIKVLQMESRQQLSVAGDNDQTQISLI